MTKKQPFGEFGTPRPKLAVYGRNLIFYFENNREELQSVINGEKIQKILFKVIYERIFFVVRLYLKYLFEFLVIWFNLPRHLNTLRKSKKT